MRNMPVSFSSLLFLVYLNLSSMEFIDFVSLWKRSTSHFTSETLWRSRLSLLNIESESSLQMFWERLKETHDNKELTNQLLSGKNHFIGDDTHSFIEHFVAKELCDFTERIFSELLTTKATLLLNDSAKRTLYTAVLAKTSTIVGGMLSFEYKVFVKAFSEEQSFSDFLNNITDKKEWLESVIRIYPLLFSDLQKFRDNYKKNISQFVHRFENDLTDIRRTFKISSLFTNIVEFNPFCGDNHREGKNTIHLALSDTINTIYSIYYKPKPLSSDCVWNDLIKKMWELGLKPSVLLTQNIDKGDYGWQKGEDANEYLLAVENLLSYCFNQGVNIGLAYFFGVQDLIADNILIKGNKPVFFDLEMIFSPIVKSAGDYLTKSEISKHYLQGVIKTGLVPCFGFETLHNTGYDNSGLRNIASIIQKEQPQNKDKFTKEILKGFYYVCNFFINHRLEIVDIIKDIVLKYPHLCSRYLVRYTFNYSQLLKALYSPYCQENSIQRHLTVEKLWRGYDKTLLSENVIQNEIRQLNQGDIPLFTSRIDSLDLLDEKGLVVSKDYFECDGISASISRILNFRMEEYALQKDIIERALFIHAYKDNSNVLERQLASSEVRHNELLLQIVDFMYSLSCGIEDDKYFAYVDFVISKNDIWDQSLQHLDIFQGTEGVGFFFMAWYTHTHEERAKDVVLKIFNESVEFLHNNKYNIIDNPSLKLGVMHFPTSILYYYIMGCKIMGAEAPQLKEEDLETLLDIIEIKFMGDKRFDYFSGASGLILILIELSKFRFSNRLRLIILKLGEYLIASSTTVRSGMISWEKESFNMWGGFAHGNSAIAYALFKLWDFFKDDKFYDAGEKALKYDQALFTPSKQYWKKTLTVTGDIHHSWGNGSAGIGLSRLLISKYYSNDIMHKELDFAIKIIQREIKEQTYTDHSIASGLMGLLEIISLLQEDFPIDEYIKPLIQDLNLSSIRCGGWIGNPTITGLYYGYAGIGYNLIKLQYSNNLPSLLWI